MKMEKEKSLSDHAKNDIQQLPSPGVTSRTNMISPASRISLPPIYLQKSHGLVEIKQDPIIDGISVIDSLLSPGQSRPSQKTLQHADLQRLLQLKESLEKIQSENKQKTQHTLKDDFELSTHTYTESAVLVYDYNSNADTGMDVLYAFGAVPARHKNARKNFAILPRSRARCSTSNVLDYHNKATKNIQMAKLSTRRASSLTQSVQSHAPNEWYELPRAVQIELANLLSWKSVSKWEFDVFEINRLTGGQSLLFIGWSILSSPYSQHVMEEVLLKRNQKRPLSLDMMEGYRFIDEFRIDQKKMTNFLRSMEEDYIKQNPYHNNIHAADVLQTLHSMLQEMGCSQRLLPSPLHLFSVLLSAVIHDVGHPGYNNFFQQKTNSDLAIRYNDQSILENMHLAMAFRKIIGSNKLKEVDIFENMMPEDFTICRKLMVETVQGTDMSKHFKNIADVKKEIATIGKDSQLKDDTSWEILHFMMHAADISNGAKPKDISVQWTDRCLEEFFKQGDTEKQMGLPVSPLCDRHTVDRRESQSGFIEFIVKPTFEILAEIFPEIGYKIVPILEKNLYFWNSQLPQESVDDIENLRRSLQIHQSCTYEKQSKGMEELIEEMKAFDVDSTDRDDTAKSFGNFSFNSAIIFEVSSEDVSSDNTSLNLDEMLDVQKSADETDPCPVLSSKEGR
jgi:hypothetical protein